MQLTPENIYLIITIASVAFSIFLYFRTPQEDLETRQAVSETEVDGKAKLLAQQLQWAIESNERRFKDMQDSIKEAFLLASNHTHSVEVKVDALTERIVSMGNQIIKLSTIIEERNNK